MASIPTNFALLDLKFSPFHNHILCAATSTGSLCFWTPTYPQTISEDLSNNGGSVLVPDVKQICCLQYFSFNVLVLSCTWHPQLPHVIGVTLSSGEIYLVRVPRSALDATDTINLKLDSLQKMLVFSGSLEAWTLAFNPVQNEMYSGSDDSVLRVHNLPLTRRLFSDDTPNSNTMETEILSMRQDRRIHGAGVTAILYLVDNLVVTGSYDNFIRVLYIPPKGRLEVITEVDLDGGVWRLSLECPSYGLIDEDSPRTFSAEILASCMHAGVRVLRVERDTEGNWTIGIIAKFEEHKSMNYGSASYLNNKSDARTVISTSFYDALACLWEYMA